MKTRIGFRSRRSIMRILFLLVVLVGMESLYSRGSQNIDPFYLRILQRGEESLTAGDYQNAVEKLEIAAFGLAADKTLKGKALVLLSLGQHHLQNTEDSDKSLKLAIELLGESGVAELELPSSLHGALQECLSRNRPPDPPKNTLQAEAGGKTPAVQTGSDPEDEIRKLQARIHTDRDNPALYFELSEAFHNRGDDKAARKTLQNLLKRKPEETGAHFRMGILDYQSRRFKEAARDFDSFFSSQGSTSFPEETLELARIYHILSAHLSGSRRKALKMLTGSLPLLNEERIQQLPLAHRDRALILQIIEDHRDLLDAQKAESDKPEA